MNTFFQHSIFPSQQALKFALRATLSSLLSLYLAFLFDLDQPQWAATTALIVAQPQSGMVLSKGMARLLGTIVGTVLSIIVMSMFSQTPLLYLLAIACILMLSVMAYTIIRSAWSYGYVMIGVTVAAILVPNIASPTTIFDVAVLRCLEISLGIIVSSIIFSTIWPIKTQQLLINNADQTIQLGFNTAIKSMKGEALDDIFLQSLSNIVAVDAQREHAIFEGQTGQNSARAILGMCQNILNILSLSRSIYRDKQHLSDADWRMINPWIQQTIHALEQGKRSDIHKVRQALELALHNESSQYTQATLITLHRIQLLLKHAIKARRFLHSARKGKPIHMINERTLSQHQNYTLGILFGLRSAFAFMAVASTWLLFGWSLTNATMPLLMSAIMCSLFAGREKADRISILFFIGSFYAVLLSLFLNIYILPNIDDFIMLACALGIPMFICSIISLNPRYFFYASINISLLMLISPNNYSIVSTEYLLNQSIGLLLGTGIAALVIILLSINMPYWHGKTINQLISQDLSQLITRPLHNANSWFNSRMADRLILLARHKVLMEEYAEYRWQNAMIALDLGDEIFFLRRVLKYNPELNCAAQPYFKTLKQLLKMNNDTDQLKLLALSTQTFSEHIQTAHHQNQAIILQDTLRHIQNIWHAWYHLNQQEETNESS